MKFNENENLVIARARKIRLLLLDVDGVLTDGRLYYSAQGEELKVFNTLDGHGLKLLGRAGLQTGVISGRKSSALERRCRDLGLDHVHLGQDDKLEVLKEVLAQTGFSLEQVAYAGDDLPDLPVINRSGLGICVPNAHPDVRAAAAVETGLSGGNGAVREICDFLLRQQGLYPEIH